MTLETNPTTHLPINVLHSPEQRAQIAKPALSLFFKIADHWSLNVDQARALLGGISPATYHNWKKGKIPSLGRDHVERLSLVFGIHKSLNLVFADEAGAKRWFTSPNTDVPFAGLSPIERMALGGIMDLYAVRRYLDAWRGMR